MKLLLQHGHQAGEIAGVLTYLNAIAPELNARGVETPTISTKKTSIWDWYQAIASADIVHMNSNHLGFALLCKLLGKKIIIKYHYLFYISTHFQYEPMSLVERLKAEFVSTLPQADEPLKWKLFTVVKWLRFIIRFSTALLVDHHVACSKFLAESHSFPWTVSHLANPIAFPAPQPAKKLEDYSTPYIFTYVGRIYYDKGIDLLLKATDLLKAQGYAFQVQIIGEGQDMATLKAMAEQLKICDRVEFLGSLPRSELLERVQKSIALVVPSRWQEPAGYVTLEASSVQTCSIVAEVGGLPEMASPYNLRFAQEDVKGLADAMKACLDDPETAIARGKYAAQYVREHFSPEQGVDQLLEICQALKPGTLISREAC